MSLRGGSSTRKNVSIVGMSFEKSFTFVRLWGNGFWIAENSLFAASKRTLNTFKSAIQIIKRLNIWKEETMELECPGLTLLSSMRTLRPWRRIDSHFYNWKEDIEFQMNRVGRSSCQESRRHIKEVANMRVLWLCRRIDPLFYNWKEDIDLSRVICQESESHSRSRRYIKDKSNQKIIS